MSFVTIKPEGADDGGGGGIIESGEGLGEEGEDDEEVVVAVGGIDVDVEGDVGWDAEAGLAELCPQY